MMILDTFARLARPNPFEGYASEEPEVHACPSIYHCISGVYRDRHAGPAGHVGDNDVGLATRRFGQFGKSFKRHGFHCVRLPLGQLSRWSPLPQFTVPGIFYL